MVLIEKTNLLPWIPLFTMSGLLTACTIAIGSFYHSDERLTLYPTIDDTVLAHYFILVTVALGLMILLSLKYRFSLFGTQLAAIAVATITLGFGIGLANYFVHFDPDRTYPFVSLGNSLILFAFASLVLNFSLIGFFQLNKASLSIFAEEYTQVYPCLMIGIGHSALFTITLLPAFLEYYTIQDLLFYGTISLGTVFFFALLISSPAEFIKTERKENEASKPDLKLYSLTKWQFAGMGTAMLGAIAAFLGLYLAESNVDTPFMRVHNWSNLGLIFVLIWIPAGVGFASLKLSDLKKANYNLSWGNFFGLYALMTFFVFITLYSLSFNLNSFWT